MSAAAAHCQLVEEILRRRSDGRILIVGINGIAGSGKTTLAKSLAELLERKGVRACRVSVDDFHHPKQHRYRRGMASPEGYYHDSVDYGAFAEGALRPAFEATRFPVRCQTRHLDLESDKEDRRFEMLPAGSVLLAEGVFLFRPELVGFMHVRIYVHAELDVILKRVLRRDLDVLGSVEAIAARYRDKYLPGETLYHDEVSPQTLADFVLDNTDPENPVLK